MLIDVVRKLLVPGECYEYLMYVCYSPYDGVHVSHVTTIEHDYDYAIAYQTPNGVTCKLLPTMSLAYKAANLLEAEGHETHILTVCK